MNRGGGGRAIRGGGRDGGGKEEEEEEEEEEANEDAEEEQAEGARGGSEGFGKTRRGRRTTENDKSNMWGEVAEDKQKRDDEPTLD